MVEALGGALAGDGTALSRSSTSEVISVAASASVRAMTTVGIVGHVGSRQAGRGQGADVLLGRDQHLATEVAALLLRRELVLPVRTGDTGGDHGLCSS